MTVATYDLPGVVLLAEDDPADQKLISRALSKSSPGFELKVVGDGAQLIDYLQRDGDYSDARRAPRPSLVLLDLNMPNMDGRTALREIKSNHDFRRIPVVVLTTSDQESEIAQCYDLGANSFITKPNSYPELVAMAVQLDSYWFELAKTPPC